MKTASLLLLGLVAVSGNAWSWSVDERLEVAFQDVKKGNFESALSNYEVILKQEPGHLDALNQVAWLYDRTGNLDKAEATSQALFKFKPEVAGPIQQRLVALQQVYRKNPAGTDFKDCPSCPSMRVVPHGAFMMGAKGERAPKEQRPSRLVAIEYPFAVSQYEITVGEYAQFVREMGYYPINDGCQVYSNGRYGQVRHANWANTGHSQTHDHPVSCVSWFDATTYVAWLANRTGKPYRLLSEAEWEYAFRASTREERPGFGKVQLPCALGNLINTAGCESDALFTQQVGQYPANGFGLKDMAGNVSEWVADCWSANHADADMSSQARQTPFCKIHVIRGGGWLDGPESMDYAYRRPVLDGVRRDLIGIRIARDLP